MDQQESNFPLGSEIRKIYYSIGEVCAQTGLEPHVLRYWESEFPQLRPKKNRAGNRAYREKDIEIITFIKKLLYEEQYTIPGAKKKLAEIRSGEAAPEQRQELSTTAHSTNAQERESIAEELRDVLRILRS